LFFHWLKAKFDSFKKPKESPIATDALVKSEGGTDATTTAVESQGEGVVDIKVDPSTTRHHREEATHKGQMFISCSVFITFFLLFKVQINVKSECVRERHCKTRIEKT
jgi:hypothetical protein